MCFLPACLLPLLPLPPYTHNHTHNHTHTWQVWTDYSTLGYSLLLSPDKMISVEPDRVTIKGVRHSVALTVR